MKDLQLFATQLTGKIPDPRNAKEHYQSFIRKKKYTKSVKQWKIIAYFPKIFESPNIINIKSVITEHPKNSHKLSKTIRQAENISQVSTYSSLYSDTKESKNFLNKRNLKITKRAPVFKVFATS